MKIAFITDMHIPGEGDQVSFDIDPVAQFNRALDEAALFHPDIYILGGDLCYDYAQKETYLWIKSRMDSLGKPYYAIPGNHDDSRLISEIFEVSQYLTNEDEIYFSFEVEGEKVLLLDSGKGIISSNQLTWIKANLKNVRMIFMHHPTVVSGVKHMDERYALQNMDALVQILKSSEKPKHIFCGHYHVDKLISTDDLHIYITPSTFFQIDFREDVFKVDHSLPGFRIIETSPNQLITFTRYISI